MTSSATHCRVLKQGQSSSILATPDHRPTLVLCSKHDEHLLSQDMCTICGSLGKGDEGNLIACSQCGQCYHPYCVNIKGLKVVITKGWRCLDCTVCELCGQPGDEAKLLLCDECELSCHTYCLNPPLKEVPQGAWKCSWCVVCRRCGAHSPGNNCDWQKNYNECGPCSSHTTCPICKIDYKVEELIIQCSDCNRWLHASCDSILDETECEIAIDQGYKCRLCRPPDINSSPISLDKTIDINSTALQSKDIDTIKLKLRQNLMSISSDDVHSRHNRNPYRKNLLPQDDDMDRCITHTNERLHIESLRPHSAPLTPSTKLNLEPETCLRPASSLLPCPVDPYNNHENFAIHLEKASFTHRDSTISGNNVDKSSETKNDLLNESKMIDGVYLSEVGLDFIKSRKLEPLKRQRAKRCSKQIKTEEVAIDGENIEDEENEMNAMLSKQDDEAKRKRLRKLSKVGIGGFSIRQRGFRITNDDTTNINLNEEQQTNDASSSPLTVCQNSSSNDNLLNNIVSAKPKRVRKAKKLTNLADQYPSYLQEAFFGKELLDKEEFKIDENNPNLTNDCANQDLVDEEYSLKTASVKNEPLETIKSKTKIPRQNQDNRRNAIQKSSISNDLPQSAQREKSEESSTLKKNSSESTFFNGEFNFDMVPQFDSKDMDNLLKDLSPQTNAPRPIQVSSSQYNQSQSNTVSPLVDKPNAIRGVYMNSPSQRGELSHLNQPPTYSNHMVSPNVNSTIETMNHHPIQHSVNHHNVHQSSGLIQTAQHKSYVEQKVHTANMHQVPKHHMNQTISCNQEQINQSSFISPSTLSPRNKMSPIYVPSSQTPSTSNSMSSPAQNAQIINQSTIQQTHTDQDINQSYQMPPSPWVGQQNDSSTTYDSSINIDQSCQYPQTPTTEDIDNMSQSKKNMKKWEEDEMRGELATSSAVLYTNTSFPNLKNEFKTWPERYKQIVKLWRQLPPERRKYYTDKARENRSSTKTTARLIKTPDESEEKIFVGVDRTTPLQNQPMKQQLPQDVQVSPHTISCSSSQYPNEFTPIHPGHTQVPVNQNNAYPPPTRPTHFNQPRMQMANQHYQQPNQQTMIRHPTQTNIQIRPNQMQPQIVGYNQNRPRQFMGTNNSLNQEGSSNQQGIATQQHHINQQPRLQTNMPNQYNFVNNNQQIEANNQLHQQNYQPQQQIYQNQSPSPVARRPPPANYQSPQYQQQHQQHYVYQQNQPRQMQNISFSQQQTLNVYPQNQIKQDIMMNDKGINPGMINRAQPTPPTTMRRPIQQQQVRPQQTILVQPPPRMQNQVGQPLQNMTPQNLNQTSNHQFGLSHQSLKFDSDDPQTIIDEEDDLKDLGPDFNILEYADPEPDKTTSAGQNNLELDADLDTYFDDRDLDVRRIDSDRRPQDSMLGMNPSNNMPVQSNQHIMATQSSNMQMYNEGQPHHMQSIQNHHSQPIQQQRMQISHNVPMNDYNQTRQFSPQQRPVMSSNQLPQNHYVGPKSQTLTQIRPQMQNSQGQTCFQPNAGPRPPNQRFPNTSMHGNVPIQSQQVINHQPRPQGGGIPQYQNQYIDSNHPQTLYQPSQPQQQQMSYHNQVHAQNVRRPTGEYQGQPNTQQYNYPVSNYQQQNQPMSSGQPHMKMSGVNVMQDKNMIVGEAVTSVEFSMYEHGSGRENEAVNFPPQQSDQAEKPVDNQVSSFNQTHGNYVQYQNIPSGQIEGNLQPETQLRHDLQSGAPNFKQPGNNDTLNSEQNTVNEYGHIGHLNQANHSLVNQMRSSNTDGSQTAGQPTTSQTSSGSAQNQLLKQLLGNCSSADNPAESPRGPVMMEPVNKESTMPSSNYISKPMNHPSAANHYHIDQTIKPNHSNLNSTNTSMQGPCVIVPRGPRPPVIASSPNYEMKVYNSGQPVAMSRTIVRQVQPGLPQGLPVQRRHDIQTVVRGQQMRQNYPPTLQNNSAQSQGPHMNQMHQGVASPQQLQQHHHTQHQIHTQHHMNHNPHPQHIQHQHNIQHPHQIPHNHQQHLQPHVQHIPQHVQSNIQHQASNVQHQQITQRHHQMISPSSHYQPVDQMTSMQNPQISNNQQPLYQQQAQSTPVNEVVTQNQFFPADQQSMSMIQPTSNLPPTKKPKVTQNIVMSQSQQSITNNQSDVIISTPTPPKLSDSDRRKNSLAERRAALEREPTPPPKERVKKRTRGPNKRSRASIDSDLDFIQDSTPKKRVRKSQSKSKDADHPISLLTSRSIGNADLESKLDESIKNGLFACGDLRLPVSRLKGSFGHGSLAYDISLNAYKQYLIKRHALQLQSSNQARDPSFGFYGNKIGRDCLSPATIVSSSSEDEDYELHPSKLKKIIHTPDIDCLIAERIGTILDSSTEDDINNNPESIALKDSAIHLVNGTETIKSLDKYDHDKENQLDSSNCLESTTGSIYKNSTSLNMRLKEHGNVSVTLTLTNEEVGGVKRILSSLSRLIDYPITQVDNNVTIESVDKNDSEKNLTNENLERAMKLFEEEDNLIDSNETSLIFNAQSNKLQENTIASNEANPDKEDDEMKPQLCFSCKTVVLDHGIKKSSDDLLVTYRDQFNGNSEVLFCSVNCYTKCISNSDIKIEFPSYVNGLSAATLESSNKLVEEPTNSWKWHGVRFARWNPSYFCTKNQSSLDEVKCETDTESQPPSIQMNTGDSSIDSNESDSSACYFGMAPEFESHSLGSDIDLSHDQSCNEELVTLPVTKRKRNDQMPPWPEGCDYLQVRPIKCLRQKAEAVNTTEDSKEVEQLNEFEYFRDTRMCVLCHEYGDGESDGPARLLNFQSGEWVHLNCALWSLDVYELENGTLMQVELACKKAMNCSVCRRPGATLKCFKARCPNYYHFRCAADGRCVFYEDKSILCNRHSKNSHSKQLHSFLVKRRVHIDRDEQKLLAETVQEESQNVLRIGGLVLLNIGQLLPHQLPSFHTRNNIFPVGFKVIRYYWSYRRFNKRCKYICSIEDDENKPKFVVISQEFGYSDEEFNGVSAQLAWQPIIDKIIKLRAQMEDIITTFPSYIRGEDLFGLNDNSIRQIVESLSGVESLVDYNFKFGRSSFFELPLAINPTGCARSEPRQKVHPKRSCTTIRANGGLKSRVPQSNVSDGDSMSPYVKHFVHSKSAQYRKMKNEWRNNVVLARSRVQGLGLFAARDIEKHTMVIEYIGLLIRNEIAERLERIHEAHNRGIYMFRLDDDRVIDATLAGGLARYINHSCNPNCVAEAVDIDRERKILIIANRKILKGEELSYDYKLAIEDDQQKISCLCGAATCKKWLN